MNRQWRMNGQISHHHGRDGCGESTTRCKEEGRHNQWRVKSDGYSETKEQGVATGGTKFADGSESGSRMEVGSDNEEKDIRKATKLNFTMRGHIVTFKIY